MREERAEQVRAEYRDRFLPARDEEWLRSYVARVEEARGVSDTAFRLAGYQKRLWEEDGVASIGFGSSVVVTGAYADPEIVDALLALRTWSPPDDPLARAKALDAEFNRILGLVWPRHNARRPSARLARIFATLQPHDVLCLLDWSRTQQFRQWLEQPSYGLGLMGRHVVLREALRGVLGSEKGLQEEILYSQFSWHVWDQILSPVDPESAVVLPVEASERATATPRLSILPAQVQRKGLTYVTANLALWLWMVRSAENGVEKEDLIQQIGEEAPGLNRTSRSNVLAIAAGMGVIGLENGVYRPTPSGRALLEGEAPAEILTPVFVRSVFGFAQILDDLRGGALTRGDIATNCRNYYPRWTSDFSSNALVAWMREMGLVQVEGVGTQGLVSLTEAGEYWASGLPQTLKAAPFLLSDQLPDVAPEPEAPALSVEQEAFIAPAFEAVLARFRQNDELKSLVFSDAQIGLIHAALHSAEGKRFVLLAGLSGAGKTSMARGYAEAYCEALGLSPEGRYLLVAVWPDWTDPSGLLGYVNPLANPPFFQDTDTLRLLLRAQSDPGKPYFLCLDEMNLARVEHYFAPFLSAMEGAKGTLALHSSRESVDTIPPSIPWPKNLFIIGTVNMDETTHPFSDKVLDRAFTFEFWDIDLAGWRAKAAVHADAAVLSRVYPVLEAFQDALKPARRHFGYRTCDEVLGFAEAASGLDDATAIDAAVLAKILPKVRGDAGGALPVAIDSAIKVSDRFGLATTGAKLRQMQAILKEMSAVRFWS